MSHVLPSILPTTLPAVLPVPQLESIGGEPMAALLRTVPLSSAANRTAATSGLFRSSSGAPSGNTSIADLGKAIQTVMQQSGASILGGMGDGQISSTIASLLAAPTNDSFRIGNGQVAQALGGANFGSGQFLQSLGGVSAGDGQIMQAVGKLTKTIQDNEFLSECSRLKHLF